jgi:hypothetical protein
MSPAAAYSSPMGVMPYLELKVSALGLRGISGGVGGVFAVLLRRTARPPYWVEVGRSEAVRGEAAPAWVESFEVSLPGKASNAASPSAAVGAGDGDGEYRVAVFVEGKGGRRAGELARCRLVGVADVNVGRFLGGGGDGGIAGCGRGGVVVCEVLRGRRESDAAPKEREAAGDGRRPSSGRFSAWTGGNGVLGRAPSESGATALSAVSGDGGWGRRGRGAVVLSGERVTPCRPGHLFTLRFEIAFRGRSGGGGGVFYVLYREVAGEDHEFAPVYRSEVLPGGGGRRLEFSPARVRKERLCAGDESRRLRVEVFRERGGGGVSVGFVDCSVGSFRFARPGGVMFVEQRDGGDGAGVGSGGRVLFEGARLGTPTRGGSLESELRLRGVGFYWDPISRHASGGGGSGGDFVDVDEDGRSAAALLRGTRAPVKQIPRGVSYMSVRAAKIAEVREEWDRNRAERERREALERSTVPVVVCGGGGLERDELPPTSPVSPAVAKERRALHTRSRVHDPGTGTQPEVVTVTPGRSVKELVGMFMANGGDESTSWLRPPRVVPDDDDSGSDTSFTPLLNWDSACTASASEDTDVIPFELPASAASFTSPFLP